MKNFIARIKAFFLLVVTWLNQWTKDHILHFVVADSIATIVWIGTAITLGWMLSPGWLTAAAAAVTIVFIIIKDYWIDEPLSMVKRLLMICWSDSMKLPSAIV